MFDTSVVKPRAMAAPGRYGLLSAAIALHSGLAVAAMALSLAAVEFPDRSPDQADTFRPIAAVVIPPPLGDGRPPRPAPARPVPASAVRSSSVPSVPVFTDTSPVAAAASTTEPSWPGDAASGPFSGDPGTGGDPNGEPGGVGTDPVVIAGPYTPGGEVRPARVLTRVEPRYPAVFSRAGVSAIVKIRCIIDSNGRIRHPEIVVSSFPPFNQSVLDAVERWTFAPGTRRGEPVDTYFELTVTFRSR